MPSPVTSAIAPILKHPERVGSIRGQHLVELKQWCQARRRLLVPSTSRYAKGRYELWLRRHCDLKKEATLTEGYRCDRLEALGERILPGFHIGLLLLYQPGVRINLHRDHTVFQPIACLVNLFAPATFLTAEMPRQKGQKLRPQTVCLNDGEVIRFNSKILHGIEPVTAERWCIVFWHLKPQYLRGI